MDFTIRYTEAQDTFRREFSEWLDAAVPADLTERPISEEESVRKYEQRRELGRRLGERGWLYPRSPPEYGGGGLDFDTALVLEEEVHKRGLRLPPYYDSGGRFGSATILVWGTESQKARFLPPIYKGEVRTWQLLSEPEAGSDLAGVRTAATRVGDHYILNGQKVYVGSDHGADRFWLIAMTGSPEDRHQNLSWFMVDADSEGITIQPQYLMSTVGEGEGDVGHKNTVYFSDVKVPVDSLVGGENHGWKVASTHLELEHGAADNINRDRFWDKLFSYCTAVKGDQSALIEDQSVRETLAEVYIRLETNRLLSMRNFWLLASGGRRTYEGSQVTYLKKVTGLWMTREILDALGPEALTNDVERGAFDGFAEEQQREGIVNMHPGGTTDIHRLIIARRLGLGRRHPEEAGSVI